MSYLSGDLIRHKLPTYQFGQSIVSVEQTGSTNTELKQFARRDAPEGMLYIADEQLVGRGRLERSWVAPPGSSLLTSLLFRPTFLTPTEIPKISMLCALAMIDAIQKHTRLAALVKWPNDIMWEDGKKLGGLLTEFEIEAEVTQWVVVGLGLNVAVDFRDYTTPEPDRPQRPGSGHPALAGTATSLSMLLGQPTNALRLPILQSYLFNVEKRYEALKQGVLPHLEWQRKLLDIGKQATVTLPGKDLQHFGEITGVDQFGALRLRQENNTIISIPAGDVTFR
jgi:BirA family biotin operon repressor/biotin-[acetyl-CoA-carboxylase] ligase